jgi:hypothetical protein
MPLLRTVNDVANNIQESLKIFADLNQNINSENLPLRILQKIIGSLGLQAEVP